MKNKSYKKRDFDPLPKPERIRVCEGIYVTVTTYGGLRSVRNMLGG